jgi:hypothetical protein
MTNTYTGGNLMANYLSQYQTSWHPTEKIVENKPFE